MNQKELLLFAKEAAKSIKTEKDITDLSRMLKKVTVEAGLGTKLAVNRVDDTYHVDIKSTG